MEGMIRSLHLIDFTYAHDDVVAETGAALAWLHLQKHHLEIPLLKERCATKTSLTGDWFSNKRKEKESAKILAKKREGRRDARSCQRTLGLNRNLDTKNLMGQYLKVKWNRLCGRGLSTRDLDSVYKQLLLTVRESECSSKVIRQNRGQVSESVPLVKR